MVNDPKMARALGQDNEVAPGVFAANGKHTKRRPPPPQGAARPRDGDGLPNRRTCATCGKSGPPAAVPGGVSNHVPEGRTECVACGLARHYGWFCLQPAKGGEHRVGDDR